MAIAAAAGPSAYWYLTRATGTITLILLTVSVALGVANVRRIRTQALPRFVLDAIHRNASLLAVAFLFVHIATSVLDTFAPIRVIDAIAPFGSSYRPIWLGLGTVASDLLIAVALTSVVRRRLGYGAWRATHWLAYASWPIAVVHGLGTGSDAKTSWLLVITAACLIVVIVAVVARATAGWPAHPAARMSALTASALVPIGLLVWLPSGPLAAGWARRAGTPSSLVTRAAATAAPTTGSPARSASSTFSAQVSGTVHQGQAGGGLVVVDIPLSVQGQRLSSLSFRIAGEPVDGGGVQMTSSRVTLGPGSDPRAYRGVITALEGTNIEAVVRDRSGARLTLVAQLQIDQGSGSVTGTVSSRPGGA
jgi:methionine sulfoxide reductase heme-binding subunit